MCDRVGELAVCMHVCLEHGRCIKAVDLGSVCRAYFKVCLIMMHKCVFGHIGSGPLLLKHKVDVWPLKAAETQLETMCDGLANLQQLLHSTGKESTQSLGFWLFTHLYSPYSTVWYYSAKKKTSH